MPVRNSEGFPSTDVVTNPVVMSCAFIVWLVFGQTFVGNGWGDVAEACMWPLMVVDLNELINQILELGDGLCWWSGGDPFLHGLLEPFNLARGGRMVGAGVLPFDPELGQACFELVPPARVASEANRVDESVIGQHRDRETIVFSGFVECVADDVPCHATVAADEECFAGVVIEPRDRFRVGAVSEPYVGEI